MFNIGAGEMVFILIAALLVLGPQRLPELARGIGRFLREFRRQTDEVRTAVVREFYQMDQEVQREPAPSPAPAASVSPPSAPAPGRPESPSLPLPAGEQTPSEAGPPAHPAPGGTAPAAVAPAGALGTVPPAGAGETPVAGSRGAAEEQEEPLPRFDPIPGTVPRNAPK